MNAFPPVSYKACKILLAEDDEINQEVTSYILTNIGHEVVVASNGVEVLELLETTVFDLILMDIHMPDMDGYETIRRIREKEQGSDTHIPVLALTANALQGDHAKCLAAGMDGYIAKPFDCDELLEVVQAYLLSQGDLEEILSLEVLMKRLGKLELRGNLIDLFKAKLPDYLKRVREAIDTGNAHDLEGAAHKLKGMVGNFSVMRAYEAAYALEKAAMEGDLSNTEVQWVQLTCEIGRLKLALNRYRIHLKE